MRDTLVGRHAAPNGEDKNSDDERPEVEFTPVAKWMIEIWRQAALVYTKKHQRIVARIHERVDRLRKHSRTTGDGGRNELNHRDSQIADDRHDDRRR